ncbi:MAG: GMC family oxidoreductase [Ilumatobacter sp.]|nr:GMC family oxidoreductase [Ilumatobacter sp.]
MTSNESVVVVGSGPCGAFAAAGLIERGIPVVMLDAGFRAPRGAVVRLGGKTLFRKKGYAEYATNRHDPSSDEPLTWISSLSLGGLSNYWTSAVPRYAPDDFTDGARLDERFRWPIGYDDLVPYYERAERELGLTAGRPIHGVPPGAAEHRVELPDDWRAIADRAQEHGHGVGALPMARGGSSMLAPRGTEYSSYHCTVARLESSPLFRLVRGAFVLSLEWSSTHDRVRSVRYVDRSTGDRHDVPARAVMLAAGAIDTTAIVLRSTSPDFPTGLGNSRDLVGRYLHDHPREWWVVETASKLTALSHPVYVARDDHASSEPLMSSSLMLGATPRWPDRLFVYTGGKVSAFGVQVLGTMVPSPDVGVRLGDWDGARPSLHLRYDAQAKRNMEAARSRIVQVLADAGLTARVPGPFHDLTPGQSVHYAGTVRMHDDPEFGVLDRWNRMHDVPNVAVVDPSCFPTGPEKNPTLTAMAIAARAADRLADDLTTGSLR